MNKRNLDIKQLFRYDPKTDTYFYHLLATWSEDKEVPKTDEWIKVSKEVYDELRRSVWRDIKRANRESRCQVRGKNGKTIRCPEKNNCAECPYAAKTPRGNPQPGKHTGGLLSLELFEEIGVSIPSSLEVETQVEKQELAAALHTALVSLSEKEYHIIILAAGGMPEHEIAARVGSKQRTVNNWKWKIRAHLREVLKDYL